MSGIRAAKLTLSLTHKRVFHQSFTAESVKTRYGFRFRESFCPEGRMAEWWNGGMVEQTEYSKTQKIWNFQKGGINRIVKR